MTERDWIVEDLIDAAPRRWGRNRFPWNRCDECGRPVKGDRLLCWGCEYHRKVRS